MTKLEDMKIKIFADGADLEAIRKLNGNPLIRGFTTNPTLMRKAGVADYAGFARDALQIVGDKPISFEVFADDLASMERQARIIAGWGRNVYVKIPITNTQGVSCVPLVSRLMADGIQVNVTAILTPEQIREVIDAVSDTVASYVSIFAGRIADSGRDPVPIVAEAQRLLKSKPAAEIIWASPREVLNIWHAESVGCQIITVTPDILAKLSLWGKDLAVYSLETVSMFYQDATRAGYTIEEDRSAAKRATA
ncbi:MAG: transaldolase [Pseudorhodoplanes sp.]